MESIGLISFSRGYDRARGPELQRSAVLASNDPLNRKSGPKRESYGRVIWGFVGQHWRNVHGLEKVRF